MCRSAWVVTWSSDCVPSIRTTLWEARYFRTSAWYRLAIRVCSSIASNSSFAPPRFARRLAAIRGSTSRNKVRSGDCESIDFLYPGGVDRDALVGKRRQQIPITDHDLSILERRKNLATQVVQPIRREQQRESLVSQSVGLSTMAELPHQRAPNQLSYRAIGGLAGPLHAIALLPQAFLQPLRLGCRPGSIDSLEHDEPPGAVDALHRGRSAEGSSMFNERRRERRCSYRCNSHLRARCPRRY